jgi:peptidoglycan/LPS O-acetylase OafA/YrhL
MEYSVNRQVNMQKLINTKQNSIGFIRLGLAFLVIFSHSFVYNNVPDPLDIFSHNQRALGSIGVDGFFFISGWLITASYLRINYLPRYFWHRCLRILPGLWIMLIVTAMFLPILFHQPPNLEYFLNNWWLFLRIEGEGSPLQYEHIHGVFTGGYMQGYINGVTWTLGHEFRCYAAVGLLGYLGVLKRRPIVVVGLFLLVWLLGINYCIVHDSFWKGVESNSLRVVGNFAIGSVFYLYKDKIPFNNLVVLSLLILAVFSLKIGGYVIFAPFVIAYLITWLSINLPFQGWDKKGDYSYGMYIYASPVQHFFSHWNFFELGFLPYFMICIFTTLPFAILSWNFIEKPALKLK